MNITGKRILISPTKFATNRTKNRIREHGSNGFMVENWRGISAENMTFLLRASDGWLGWVHKGEFHLEACGEEFFVSKFNEKTA